MALRTSAPVSLLVALLLLAGAASAAAQPRPAPPPGDTARPAPRVSPEDAEARRLFDIGAQAFAGGRFAEALDHFEAAYQMSPRPALLYNIGLSQDRLRLDSAAIASFERFLAEVPDTAKRAEVEGRLAALRQATRRESEREARAAIERDQLALNARDADLRARTAEGKSGGVFASPWFWVVVGVVVVGAGTATAVAIATHDPGVQSPVVGEGGVVVIALGSP